jgi:histidyl-tRNA synthetase
VLPAAVRQRLVVEASSSFGWHKYTGFDGDSVSIDRFGASAPGPVCLEKFGFTVDNVVAWLQERTGQLDAASQGRIHTNPLRVLDSKNPQTQALLADAPSLATALCPESRQRFSQVQQGLEALEIPFVLNPRLVRGLDYYSHTAFEITSSQLGAQATVCGGGRYDGLVQQLGGPEAPAIGWALGMERLALLLAQSASSGAPAASPAVADLYLVSRGEAAEAMALPVARQCRSVGLAVEIDASGSAFGKQFKRADRSGARWAVVIGDEEAAEGVVVLKDLRAAAPASDLRLTPQELVSRLRPA